MADPRYLLAKVIDALKADGYYPVMAAELEFYLLDQKPDCKGRPQPAREAFGAEFLGVYLAVKRAEYRQFMGEVGEQDWRWYLHQA